ncbi:MAG: amidohydrolase family protein [Pseudomonadota bacterium]
MSTPVPQLPDASRRPVLLQSVPPSPPQEIPTRASSRWRGATWVLVVLGAVPLLVLLFVGPLGMLLQRVAQEPPIAHALELLGRYELPAFGGAALVGGALGGWLLWRGHRRTLAMLLVAGALLAVLYGALQFRQQYPRADLFEAGRLADAGAILLGEDIRLMDFDPEPQLRVPRTPDVRAAFPVIDFHFHLASLPPDIDAARLVAAMDAANVAAVVDLDGSPRLFERHAREFRARYPDRFILFHKPDFGAIRRPGGIETEVARMIEAARNGARGLKVNKSLGLTIRDATGARVPIDDPRLDPIWRTAARLGLPVLIHSADPPAFFLPPTRRNERYEELVQNPEWARPAGRFPPFGQLMAERERLLARHPETIVVGAHVGSNEEDLAYAAVLLDRFPNYYVDISSRVAGLGRQPYSAYRFMVQYQDRIVFGSDGGFGLHPTQGWTPERFFRSYLEFLETRNEYIEYPLWGMLNQGRWRVHGIGLPREVLQKMYSTNAQRILPSPVDLQQRLAALP